MGPVRLVGTAAVCVLAAFGAAFLLARAIDHQSTARADSSPPRLTATDTTTTDTRLADQFAPGLVALKRAPRHHRAASHPHHPKPAVAHPAVTSASAPVSHPTTTTPAYTAPTYTAPAYSPPPSTSSGSSPTTSSGGSSGGGTHHKSSGSGTTTIG